MEKIATVISADNKTALVQLMRASACGENCASCGGCKGTHHTAKVTNSIGAQTGQKVKVEMEGKSLIFISFLAYIVPLLALFLGYGISYFIWYNEILSDLLGIFFLLLSFVFLRSFDRKISRSGKYRSRITKILSE